MKKIFTKTFSLVCLVFLIFSACKIDNISNLPRIDHELVNDTIKLENLDFSGKFSSPKIIDIKKFNDTVFLFTFYQTNDSLYFMTFYMNNGFQLHNIKEIIGEMKTDFFEKKHESMFVVSHDEIIILSKNAITSYCLSNNKIICNYSFEESEVFLSNSNPIIFDDKMQFVFSEYIDFSKPKNSLGVIKTEIIAGINLNNSEVLKIPIFVPEDKNYLKLNTFHFTTTENSVVSKLGIEDRFAVYNFKEKSLSYVNIPFAKELMPDFEKAKENSYDDLKSNFRKSFLANALCFDKISGNFVFSFLNIAPERNKDGLMPEAFYRSKLLFIFDSNLKIKGVIELIEDTFYPKGMFAIDNVIYLLTGFKESIVVKTVSYEI